MQIDIFMPDSEHPAYKHISKWADENGYRLVNSKAGLFGGDYLFLISCTELVRQELDLYTYCLVIHESNLPEGRGWSPLAWQVLQGKSSIVFSLFEAVENVDEGPVWLRDVLKLDGSELNHEIHEKTANLKIQMMERALMQEFTPEPQEGIPTYYPRRKPEDSEIDPHKSIAQQFNLLRICDSRFPAFFYLNGRRYEITIH